MDDSIHLSFPDIDTALQALESLRKQAEKLEKSSSSLSRSRGAGTEELKTLSRNVAAFASALEREIACGKDWLKATKRTFASEDKSAAKGFSDL